MGNLKDVALRFGTGIHEAVFRATGGRFVNQVHSMPVVILTTTGRKSGKRRTTMLTTPVCDDDRIVLVASYGGDRRHPAWFLNVRDNPAVEILMKGRTRQLRARVATAEEKAELWPQVVAAYRGYGAYQRRTDRDIPLVILESASAAG